MPSANLLTPGFFKEFTANSAGVAIKASPGTLRKIIVTLPGAATIRLYDSSDGTGLSAATAIIGGAAATALPAAGSVLNFDCNFLNGLWIVVASVATTSFTVVFN